MSVLIAMVALGPDARLSVPAITADMAAHWPSLSPATQAEQEGTTFSFNVGGHLVAGGWMPAPIPWGDLEGPCATSWMWGNAAQELRRHTSHLIVTVASEAGTPVERLRLLTITCAAILGTCPQAVGVYWCPATLVMQPALFRDFALEVSEFPIYIWVDFRVGTNPHGKTSGFTAGLESLGLMELETEDATDSPGDLRERFAALAGYLVENGPVIRDGDTVGESAEEKIRVVYSPSAFGREGQVMRLQYASAGKKPWWKMGR